MTWSRLLDEFRALGGTAENVELRGGSRGRGIFAITPKARVKLHVPTNLLIAADDIEIRDGGLVVKTTAMVGESERAFFEAYQRDFSWSAFAFGDLWNEQIAWSVFPREIQESLRHTWGINPFRFSTPSDEICLQRYVRTRTITYGGVRVVHPISELVNHGSDAAPYETKNGVGICGEFEDEVLANYSADDCWGTALAYGLCAPRDYAHSMKGTFKFDDMRITISRHFGRAKRWQGIARPIVSVEDESIVFSFLTLANARIPDVPRELFLDLVRNTTIKRPNELFDQIRYFNSHSLINFLQSSQGAESSPLAMLRKAAREQLVTLSGTKSPANC